MFAFGVYVGGGLSSLSIALAEVVGWRGSAYTVAGYGLLLSLLVRFSVREPPRTPAVTAPSPAPSHEPGGDSDGSSRGSGACEGGSEKDYTAKDRCVCVLVLSLLPLLMLPRTGVCVGVRVLVLMLVLVLMCGVLCFGRFCCCRCGCRVGFGVLVVCWTTTLSWLQCLICVARGHEQPTHR